MHIKRIAIQGFKTYKNTTVIDDISPGHNVVVGRNGSGKSNFFAAIRFVLSDQFTRMSKEERQGLIHEGSGTVLSAYVEIVFDNSEHRFPTGKDEVVIRRTIGLKKDDYSLDQKSSTRQDIMQLLESAGFSRSNPYYIVPQGRITSLTNARDSERLSLLKEVAGAQVFENKLKESQKEMTKTKLQQDKIDEMLEFIQERLSDLDSEKNDLKVLQDLEKEKKIYEFILHDRELNEITNAIEEIDSDYQTAIDNSQKFFDDLEKREALTKDLTFSIKESKHDLKLLTIDENQCSTSLDEITKQVFGKSAELSEIKDTFESNQTLLQQNQHVIKQLTEEVSRDEKILNSKKPKVERLKASERDLKLKLDTLKTKQRILLEKQGRFSRFSSQTERDSFIKNQIKVIETELIKANTESSTIINQVSQSEARLTEINEQVDDIQDTLNGPSAQAEIQGLESKINELRRQYYSEVDSRKNLWREESYNQNILESLNQEVRQAESDVNQTMDRQQSSGLEAVKRISERLGISGVYGPLGELIQVNPKYRNAVEVVAGNSLFHVVVENDEVASTLMDELIRERAGRVTFMPLNRLNPNDPIYPDSNDSVPLIKKVGFDPKIQNAVKQVIGKTIVVVNLERGRELSREYKLNAITLDGDKADKRGVLTGGFHDHKRSRLEAMRVKQDKYKSVQEREKIILNIRNEIAKKDNQIIQLNNEQSKLSSDLENLISSKKPLKSKLSAILDEKFRLQEDLKLAKDQLIHIQRSIETYNTRLSELNIELSSNFKEGLSDDEKRTLNDITIESSTLEKQLSKVTDSLFVDESALINLESKLNQNLRPRLQELLKLDSSSEQNNLDSKIQELSEELETLQEEKEVIEAKVVDIREQIIAKNNELSKQQASLEKVNGQQRKLVETLEKYQNDSEKYLSKKSLLSRRRDETQKKIRELGALPEEAFDENEEISSNSLLQRLTEVSKNLERFSHVNRKALEQYSNFTKQRDSLVDRRKELDKSEESIMELINVLESRKDNAIQKTFEQVSIAFSEVFEKLVPKGVGKLIMQVASKDSEIDLDDEEEDLFNDDHESTNVENYSGVSIQVSFNSKNDEQQRIEQLSGGQKSLCAIALIFAIQKADPAPFYLFDEIDANLDTQYRTAVANLIHELSENAQFICTTFRPEMLQVANKFFGVMFNNKISTVSEIDRKDALGFIENQQQQRS